MPAELCCPRVYVCVCVFQSVVDKLLKKANVSLVVGTSSWREQFVEAITVSAGNTLIYLSPHQHLPIMNR